MRAHRNTQAGFTLVELTIVMAIIATVTSMALPNIRLARKTANEISAIASLRTILTVNEQFRLRFSGYASDLAELQSTRHLDRILGSGRKSGYRFSYQARRHTWSCSADPVNPGVTGDRHFFVDQSGVIYVNAHAAASDRDTPID